MKVTVNANDFCPDDCPYCDIDYIRLQSIEGEIKKYYCANNESCRFARIIRKEGNE